MYFPERNDIIPFRCVLSSGIEDMVDTLLVTDWSKHEINRATPQCTVPNTTFPILGRLQTPKAALSVANCSENFNA